MARLTLSQLEQALSLKVEGKTYADIAEYFNVANDHNLRQQIKAYLDEGVVQLSLNLVTSVALDRLRVEQLISPMMSAALEDKSVKHVDAVVKLMRLKLDQLKFLQELQGDEVDRNEQGTFKTDDDLYLEAFDLANASILEGDYEVKEDVVYADLDPEELKMLETQLVDLDANIKVMNEDDDGRSEDF